MLGAIWAVLTRLIFLQAPPFQSVRHGASVINDADSALHHMNWLKLSAWTQGRTEKRAKAPPHSYAEGQGGSRRGPGCHFRLHSNVSLSIFRSSGSALIESVITVTNTTKMFLFNGMAVRNLSQAENYNEVKPQWCWHTHALSQVECVAAACDSVKHTSDPDKRWLKIFKKGAWNYFCTHVHVNV